MSDLDVVHRTVPRYDEEVEETAFVCFIESDRNISRATSCLHDRLGDEIDQLPDRSTISRWAKNKGWDAKADEAIALAFPAIRRRQMARVVSLVDKAIETYAAVMAGEYANLRQADIMARVAVAKDAMLLAGVGTAGSRLEGAQIAPQAPIAYVEEDLSPLERARRQRARLEAEQD